MLLDLNLRGFSGVGAYRLLRSDERYALLPVIVVSARPDARELLAGVGGVDGFVTKPFNVNTLADLVAERIASAAQLREDTASDPITGLLGQDYVEARLADELTVVAPDATGRLRARAPALGAGDHHRGRRPRHVATWCGSSCDGPASCSPATPRSGSPTATSSPILLPGCTSAQAVDLLQDDHADDRAACSCPAAPRSRSGWRSGVAAYPEHAAGADELYMAADAALADAVDRGNPFAVAI